MLNRLLEQYGVNYEDLNAAEKETLEKWQKALEVKELSVATVTDHVKSLIDAVEKELVELKESTSFWTYLYQWKKDFYLKARLKNYLLLYDFLSTPEKARKYVEQSIKNIK